MQRAEGHFPPGSPATGQPGHSRCHLCTEHTPKCKPTASSSFLVPEPQEPVTPLGSQAEQNGAGSNANTTGAREGPARNGNKQEFPSSGERSLCRGGNIFIRGEGTASSSRSNPDRLGDAHTMARQEIFRGNKYF